MFGDDLMGFANKVTRASGFVIIISLLTLAAACNTTPVTRSSGAPGSPGSPAPSGSPGSSGPSIQVEAPGLPGMPGPPGLPTTGSGDVAGAPTPVTVSIPAPQPGMPSGDTGAASPTAQSGDRQQPAGAKSATAGGQGKTDDEILAEALEELGKRPGQEQQGEGAAGPAPQAGTGAPAITDAEKKQGLGEELEQGFAEFDELMLSEQQANNERADQEGYGEFLDDDFPAEGDPAQGPAGEPLQTAMVDSDPVSIEGEMDIPTRSHSQVPPDLVDASGDDIIARQLREAAMKERDPELREKLWDEYRKYKRDLR